MFQRGSRAVGAGTAPASPAQAAAGVAASSPAGAAPASPGPDGGQGGGLIIFRWGGLELVPVPGTSGTAIPGG
jgi:hypothetical protein